MSKTKNKSATEYKKALKKLTESVLSFENMLDRLMKEPSSHGRGTKISKLTNWLTIQNQAAMHFTLGYSFKKIKKLYGGD